MVKHRTAKSQGKQASSKVESSGLEPKPEEISEAEQWRLISDSGILQKADTADSEQTLDMGDEIFNAVLLIIPFSFLYLMMDILIHQQYGKHPSLGEYFGRLTTAVPVLCIFIFYTNRHKSKRPIQMGLLLGSLAAGTRLIWLVNRAPWYVIMRQGPPLATIWIYTIAILDLLPAVVGLSVVAAWVRWTGMKLVF